MDRCLPSAQDENEKVATGLPRLALTPSIVDRSVRTSQKSTLPMRTLPALVALAVLGATSARTQTTPDFQSLVHLFDYDNKLPLEIQDKVIEEFPDSTFHDITYTSPKGGPVDAYLVVPKGKGPFAAIVFGH